MGGLTCFGISHGQIIACFAPDPSNFQVSLTRYQLLVSNGAKCHTSLCPCTMDTRVVADFSSTRNIDGHSPPGGHIPLPLYSEATGSVQDFLQHSHYLLCSYSVLPSCPSVGPIHPGQRPPHDPPSFSHPVRYVPLPLISVAYPHPRSLPARHLPAVVPPLSNPSLGLLLR